MNFGVGGFGRRGRPGGRGKENCDRRRIMMGLPKIGGGARRGQHPRSPAGLERGGRPGRPARVRGPGRHHRQGSAGNAPIAARGRTRPIGKSRFVLGNSPRSAYYDERIVLSRASLGIVGALHARLAEDADAPSDELQATSIVGEAINAFDDPTARKMLRERYRRSG